METSNPPLRAIGGPNPGRGLFTILSKGLNLARAAERGQGRI